MMIFDSCVRECNPALKWRAIVLVGSLCVNAFYMAVGVMCVQDALASCGQVWVALGQTHLRAALFVVLDIECASVLQAAAGAAAVGHLGSACTSTMHGDPLWANTWDSCSPAFRVGAAGCIVACAGSLLVRSR
jgi:hypothetical protein